MSTPRSHRAAVQNSDVLRSSEAVRDADVRVASA